MSNENVEGLALTLHQQFISNSSAIHQQFISNSLAFSCIIRLEEII